MSSAFARPLPDAGAKNLNVVAPRGAPGKGEAFFFGFVFFLGTNAFGDFTVDPSSLDDPISRAVWFLVFALFLMIAWPRRKQLMKAFSSRKLFVVFFVWVFASTLWSDDPVRTVVHGTMLLLSTLMGVYIAQRFSVQQQMKILIGAFTAIAICSLFAGLFFPNTAIMTQPAVAGCWRGIMVHKNGLGKIMACASALALISSGPKFYRAGLLSLALALLALSRSGTSAIVLVLMVAMIPAGWLLRQSTAALVGVGTAFISVAAAASVWVATHWYTVFYSVLDYFGKSSTLTGRGPLWFKLIALASLHPWRGYGYDAFWLGYNGVHSSMLWAITGWKPGNAHNGALQVVMDLGLVGLIIVLAMLATSLFAAIRAVRRSRNVEYSWPVMFFVFLIFANIAEATVMAPHDTYWIMFVVASYSLLTTRVPLKRVAAAGAVRESCRLSPPVKATG